jgi:hypothetical protein
MSSLYRRAGTCWIKYYRGERPNRENAHSDKVTDLQLSSPQPKPQPSYHRAELGTCASLSSTPRTNASVALGSERGTG